MRISIIYIFLQILFFGGLLKCFLASAFFFVLFCFSFFWRRPTIITYFFNWDPPSSFQHKEASYGLLYDFSNILYTIKILNHTFYDFFNTFDADQPWPPIFLLKSPLLTSPQKGFP